MYKIQTLNKISTRGLDLLPRDDYEYASEIVNPDGIILRSHKIHDMEFPENLKAIARAGAGVNNIPIERCSERGVIVFNTPGANANSVKEIVIAGMIISSRRIVHGIAWAKSLADKGKEVTSLIEKGKKDFVGPEIKGKKLGVIGLGAIGVMVANDAAALGMEVTGFDPFLSVDAAWGLSRSIQKAKSLDSLISEADYISLHVPLNDDTKDFIDKNKFKLMKKGVRLLNFARGGLVNNKDLAVAMDQGIVSAFVTDFPNEDLLQLDNVIPVPHLGASTPESEENCAVMAVSQIRNFLEYGNIKNSVNFPECELSISGKNRLIIANQNIPNMIGQITPVLADSNLNIADMINKSRGDYAYNIIDIDSDINGEVIGKLKAIEGVIMARVL